MSKSEAVSTVSESLSNLKEKLEALKNEWSPIVIKLKNHIILLEKELVLATPASGDLSVTAQVLLEEFIAKAEPQIAELAAAHRGAHASVSKVGKDIERNFAPSLGGLIKNERKLEKDPKATRLVNGMICDYLMTAGHTEIAQTFVKECGLEGRLDHYLCQKNDADRIMNAFRQNDFRPALEYLENYAPHENRLIFDLLKQNMLKLIVEEKRLEAITYARRLVGYGADEEVAHLMGAVVAKKEDPRYADLHSPVAFHLLKKKLAAVLFRIDSDLALFVETGVNTVPSLLHLKSIMASRQDCLTTGDELPIEIEMPFYSHSTFTCPILRQQATDRNPPMRLLCGHVISKEALDKLSSTNRHFRLKCPYCPEESSRNDAKRVYF